MFDTIFVTTVDSVSVTDTLIIDVIMNDLGAGDATNTIKVYPNPAKDYLYINTGSGYQQMNDYIVKIVSLTGAVVFESNINQQLFEIDINEFGKTGLFLIQIIDNNSQISEQRKILLE